MSKQLSRSRVRCRHPCWSASHGTRAGICASSAKWSGAKDNISNQEDWTMASNLLATLQSAMALEKSLVFYFIFKQLFTDQRKPTRFKEHLSSTGQCGEVMTAAWEDWFTLAETWGKNLKSKPICGPPLSLSDLFIFYFLSRMELLLLLPLHHTVKELFKGGIANFCSSSHLHQIFEKCPFLKRVGRRTLGTTNLPASPLCLGRPWNRSSYKLC